MTDSSSFANSLTEPLRQPLWWAALASVSLHGAIGVSAPTISNLIYGDPNSKNRPGSVGLIELTPSEIGRLPQTIPAKPSNNSPFSISPVPLPRNNPTPPLPPAPSTIDLPALPPGMPPPGFFSPGPLPTPNFNTPLPPTPEVEIPKSPPPKPPSVILQQPPNNLIIPPRPSDFDRNIPPPTPSPSLVEPPLFPPLNPDEQFDRDALRRRIAQSGLSGEFSNADDIATPDDFRPGGRFADGADRVPRLTQKDPNKRGLFPETPEEIARRQQFEGEQRRLEGQPGSGATASRGEKIANAGERYIALFEKFKRAHRDLEMTGPTPFNVPYPPAACAQKLEGVAVVGAVVSPQGAVVAFPDDATIASTGYSILDEAVKSVLIDPSTRFSPASTHRLYQLAIEFKYDTKICGGVPPTRTPAPAQVLPPSQPSPTPAPAQVKPNFEKEAKPAPAPQPSPQPKPAPVQQRPSPQPQRTPVQPPTPAPEQSPRPVAEPSPTPEPNPAPTAEPSPTLETNPVPAPESTPTPGAEASPAPASTPAPEAEASPAPAPTPAPEAAPSPAAEPTPAPTPSPAG